MAYDCPFEPVPPVPCDSYIDLRCEFSCWATSSRFYKYCTQWCVFCSGLPITPSNLHYEHRKIMVGHLSWCAKSFSYGRTSWQFLSAWQHLNMILLSKFLVIRFTRSNWLFFLQKGQVLGFCWNQWVLQSPHRGFSHILHSIGLLRTLLQMPQISSARNASTCDLLNILSSS